MTLALIKEIVGEVRCIIIGERTKYDVQKQSVVKLAEMAQEIMKANCPTIQYRSNTCRIFK